MNGNVLFLQSFKLLFFPVLMAQSILPQQKQQNDPEVPIFHTKCLEDRIRIFLDPATNTTFEGRLQAQCGNSDCPHCFADANGGEGNADTVELELPFLSPLNFVRCGLTFNETSISARIKIRKNNLFNLKDDRLETVSCPFSTPTNKESLPKDEFLMVLALQPQPSRLQVLPFGTAFYAELGEPYTLVAGVMNSLSEEGKPIGARLLNQTCQLFSPFNDSVQIIPGGNERLITPFKPVSEKKEFVAQIPSMFALDSQMVLTCSFTVSIPEDEEEGEVKSQNIEKIGEDSPKNSKLKTRNNAATAFSSSLTDIDKPIIDILTDEPISDPTTTVPLSIDGSMKKQKKNHSSSIPHFFQQENLTQVSLIDRSGRQKRSLFGDFQIVQLNTSILIVVHGISMRELENSNSTGISRFFVKHFGNAELVCIQVTKTDLFIAAVIFTTFVLSLFLCCVCCLIRSRRRKQRKRKAKSATTKAGPSPPMLQSHSTLVSSIYGYGGGNANSGVVADNKNRNSATYWLNDSPPDGPTPFQLNVRDKQQHLGNDGNFQGDPSASIASSMFSSSSFASAPYNKVPLPVVNCSHPMTDSLIVDSTVAKRISTQSYATVKARFGGVPNNRPLTSIFDNNGRAFPPPQMPTPPYQQDLAMNNQLKRLSLLSGQAPASPAVTVSSGSGSRFQGGGPTKPGHPPPPPPPLRTFGQDLAQSEPPPSRKSSSSSTAEESDDFSSSGSRTVSLASALTATGASEKSALHQLHNAINAIPSNPKQREGDDKEQHSNNRLFDESGENGAIVNFRHNKNESVSYL